MTNWCHNTLSVRGISSDAVSQFLTATIRADNTGKPVFQLCALVPAQSNFSPVQSESTARLYWGCPDCLRNVSVTWTCDTWNPEPCVVISFDSADLPPYLWLQDVCRLYPYLNFKLFYAEPISHICGLLDCTSGHMVIMPSSACN